MNRPRKKTNPATRAGFASRPVARGDRYGLATPLGPGGWKNEARMTPRSVAFTTPSPLKSASGSVVKNTLRRMPRSVAFTMPSSLRSASQALPKPSPLVSR